MAASSPLAHSTTFVSRHAMLYKFKSKATGDLIMLGPVGDQVLQALGRQPAASGIIEVADMPAARQHLQAALAGAEADATPAAAAEAGPAADENPASAVGLHARLWPMMQMLERAEAAKEPIVWGV
jgi:hypothetical protein